MSELELSAEELQLLESFREAMADPNRPQGVLVQHESLGQTPQGEKLQFRSGKPDYVPDPAPRGFTRWERREQRRLEALRAAKARAEKNRKSVFKQVQAAMEKLEGRTVPETLQIISALSMKEAQIYALAEELGANRKTVLQHPAIPAASRTLREEYQAEVETIREMSEA